MEFSVFENLEIDESTISIKKILLIFSFITLTLIKPQKYQVCLLRKGIIVEICSTKKIFVKD